MISHSPAPTSPSGTAAAEIRPVQFEDLNGWLRSLRTTYLMDASLPTTDAMTEWWRRVLDPERTFGAYSGDRCVATLRTFPTTLSVPSGAHACAEIPADALTQVSVSGTHRRKGLLTQMLTRSLADARERGEVVSVLRAAEWPIYGRFGYGVASSASTYTVRPELRPSILAPVEPITVTQVDREELVDPSTLAGPGPELLSARRRQQAGHIHRPGFFWERILGLNGLTPGTTREPVCVLATDAGGTPVGYAIWTAKEGDWFEAKVEITLHELITVTDDAYRALWSYLLNLDLVGTISWTEQAPDEPLQWLLDNGRAARQDRTHDELWLRILDVPRALSARRYAVQDELVLDVIDTDAGGWAAGRYVLDGGPDDALCSHAPGRSPDLTMSQRALAAVYLSGQTVWSQHAAGLVSEETSGALNRLEAMLSSARSPWNATLF